MQILVRHTGISDFARANPSLTALAVREFYHLAYAKLKEATLASGQTIDLNYAYNVLCANLELWMIEQDTLLCLEKQPCTCYNQQNVCGGCQENEALEDEFLNLMVHMLDGFRYDPEACNVVMNTDHFGTAIIDGETVVVYAANMPYTSQGIMDVRPTPRLRPVTNVFSRYQSGGPNARQSNSPVSSGQRPYLVGAR
ncbi:hypothetical protein [Vibrio phage vB_VmeM-Yong XC32]|nr:hypothetical protein [Vibrio phage vB_VmeM-Yong XC31]QAX96388.1 hypothetical protein [Vibrio phage vB_VmeM-Yong XC32]QAX96706.1 hypothetical protein [Vibrio phage vB_VmeM-Yong MS31]QAX97024.1 hypothetical protein [Vibrio phage vB_VmeM-Yong MS32]